MVNINIDLINQRLKILKEQQNWSEILRICHNLELEISYFPVSKIHLKCYLHLFEIYHLKKDFISMHYYFERVAQNIVKNGDPEDFEIFLKTVMQARLLYIQPNEVLHVIESIQPLLIQLEKYDLLAYCYIEMGYIHLLKGSVDLALQEVKLAHFHAQLLQPTDLREIQFKSQLYLQILLIHKQEYEKFDYYIHRFQWLQRSASSEKMFYNSLNLLLLLQKNQFNACVDSIKNLFVHLLKKDKVTHFLTIIRQFAQLIYVKRNLLPSTSYKELTILLNTLFTSIHYFQNATLRHFHKTSLRISPLPEKHNFYIVGQQLLQQARLANELTVHILLSTNLAQLTTQEQLHLKETLHIIDQDFTYSSTITKQINDSMLFISFKTSINYFIIFEKLIQFEHTLNLPMVSYIHDESLKQFSSYKELLLYLCQVQNM